MKIKYGEHKKTKTKNEQQHTEFGVETVALYFDSHFVSRFHTLARCSLNIYPSVVDVERKMCIHIS